MIRNDPLCRSTYISRLHLRCKIWLESMFTKAKAVLGTPEVCFPQTPSLTFCDNTHTKNCCSMRVMAPLEGQIQSSTHTFHLFQNTLYCIFTIMTYCMDEQNAVEWIWLCLWNNPVNWHGYGSDTHTDRGSLSKNVHVIYAPSVQVSSHSHCKKELQGLPNYWV